MANVNFGKWVLMKGRGANPIIHRKRCNGEFPWMERPPFVWEVEIAVGDFTGAAATSQALDLDALYPGRPFIDDVYLEPGAELILLTAFAGGAVSACTAELGDTDDPNGLVTASNVFTGATLESPIVTPAAAQYALRPETGFLPLLTLRTTNANVSALTAGRLLARIPFTPFRST